MKSLKDIRTVLEKNKTKLFEKYHLKKLGIFGSYSRQEQQDASDLDILVEFEKPVGIEFIDLAEELEKILKIKVDLVSINGIKEKYWEKISRDLTYV